MPGFAFDGGVRVSGFGACQVAILSESYICLTFQSAGG